LFAPTPPFLRCPPLLGTSPAGPLFLFVFPRVFFFSPMTGRRDGLLPGFVPPSAPLPRRVALWLLLSSAVAFCPLLSTHTRFSLAPSVNLSAHLAPSPRFPDSFAYLFSRPRQPFLLSLLASRNELPDSSARLDPWPTDQPLTLLGLVPLQHGLAPVLPILSFFSP